MKLYQRLKPRAVFNPFALKKFCRKSVLKLVWAVFWSPSGDKELNLTTNPFTDRRLGSSMRKKQNFERVQKWHGSLHFFFSLSLLPFFFSLFLPHFFFFFLPRAFSRLHFGGKCFWESFQGLRIRQVSRFWNKIYMFFFFCLFLWPSWLNRA